MKINVSRYLPAKDNTDATDISYITKPEYGF